MKSVATYQPKVNARPGGKYIYSLGIAAIFVLSLLTDWYSSLSIILFCLVVFMMLDKLGKGVILRETIALHSLFVCVLMPTLGYAVYNQQNALARLWVRYMPVAEATYFNFALPAMSGFVLMICWPVNSKKISDEGHILSSTIEKARLRLKRMPNVGIQIISTGLVMSFVAPFMPGGITFVAILFFWSSFAGALYLFYTPAFKFKKLILWGFALFIFVGALENGMFTLVAYMGITIFSFLFMGRRLAFWKKLSLFIVGCFLLLLLQSVKGSYRNFLWRQGYEGNKAVLFGNLIGDKLANYSDFFSEDAFFPFYYRTNQGFNVSLVMLRFPARAAFDNGTNLALSLASSMVPRLIWPGKPEAGGKFNMKYYTGITLFGGWSTNVGPLGEAYGSFGVNGGILYMIFLGALIRWAYKRVFVIGNRLPLIIVWIPVIFYQITYSAETDSLQIFNSLVKSAFFVWIIAKILPGWLGIEEKNPNRRRVVPQTKNSPLTQ